MARRAHDVVDFVLATQPKEWKKIEQHHGAAVCEQFLNLQHQRRRVAPSAACRCRTIPLDGHLLPLAAALKSAILAAAD